MSFINTAGCRVPPFLKQTMKESHKHDLEVAYASYCRLIGYSASFAATQHIKIPQLHPQLCDLDRAWQSIDIREIRTTQPRKLVHQMNTHLNRIRSQHLRVQRIIDSLPPLQQPDPENEEPTEQGRTESEDDQEEPTELRANKSRAMPPPKPNKEGLDTIFYRRDGVPMLTSSLKRKQAQPPSPTSVHDVAEAAPDNEVEVVGATPEGPPPDAQPTP